MAGAPKADLREDKKTTIGMLLVNIVKMADLCGSTDFIEDKFEVTEPTPVLNIQIEGMLREMYEHVAVFIATTSAAEEFVESLDTMVDFTLFLAQWERWDREDIQLHSLAWLER